MYFKACISLVENNVFFLTSFLPLVFYCVPISCNFFLILSRGRIPVLYSYCSMLYKCVICIFVTFAGNYVWFFKII